MQCPLFGVSFARTGSDGVLVLSLGPHLYGASVQRLASLKFALPVQLSLRGSGQSSLHAPSRVGRPGPDFGHASCRPKADEHSDEGGRAHEVYSLALLSRLPGKAVQRHVAVRGWSSGFAEYWKKSGHEIDKMHQEDHELALVICYDEAKMTRFKSIAPEVVQDARSNSAENSLSVAPLPFFDRNGTGRQAAIT